MQGATRTLGLASCSALNSGATHCIDFLDLVGEDLNVALSFGLDDVDPADLANHDTGIESVSAVVVNFGAHSDVLHRHHYGQRGQIL